MSDDPLAKWIQAGTQRSVRASSANSLLANFDVENPKWSRLHLFGPVGRPFGAFVPHEKGDCPAILSPMRNGTGPAQSSDVLESLGFAAEDLQNLLIVYTMQPSPETFRRYRDFLVCLSLSLFSLEQCEIHDSPSSGWRPSYISCYATVFPPSCTSTSCKTCKSTEPRSPLRRGRALRGLIAQDAVASITGCTISKIPSQRSQSAPFPTTGTTPARDMSLARHKRSDSSPRAACLSSRCQKPNEGFLVLLATTRVGPGQGGDSRWLCRASAGY
ncbi:hypothetical protein B0H11DRAFT_894617 [Mycena galericulata]|nr:hypothetical protein B0H11DRAFT_894617 [Mycena galericulata]